MVEPRWLTEQEDRAWRGYRQLRTLLDLHIARDLAADTGLSEADYDVLSTLSETPGHRLRLLELAQRTLWTPSRLSHQVSRMQARKLVRRESLPTNSRAAVVILTDTGLRAIQAAAPGHVESVRRHFIDLLSAEQIDNLAELADAALARLRAQAELPM
ncbi:MAG TPA: MarR family winged helix-turn-helix transcriptional regulator [Pseudonocardiaceae bacterium]|nr:MarR family winged helix-turn-helix transcriptional regulator [Pseudonocardiaceae bacterium]